MNEIKERYSFGFLQQQGKTAITAHSGCEGTPDNSREHILAAIASGAEMIEVDVRQTQDGLLYLSHDATEDIGECPTLRELFELIEPEKNMAMNLDVKTDGLIEPAMALASKFDLAGRIIFTGSCDNDRKLANDLGADVWRGARTISEGIATNRADGCPFLNVHFSHVTEEFEKELRSFGASFSAWTVNDEDKIRQMLEMGIGNITTRNPVLALKLRKEIQGI